VPEEIRHPDGRIEHPSVRHEPTDASLRWIIIVLIGALGLAALIHYVILVFFQHYNRYQSDIKKSPYPLAPAPSKALPPEPRLEQLNRVIESDIGNVYIREKAKEEILNSIGPTDDKGFVHVPIDWAMEHLAKKGMKVRKLPADGAAERSHGLEGWGASDSGRKFRRKPSWHER
jgi:hypothetical protein